jgi:hypothetical protein
MAERRLCPALEFGDNALGQHFAKFHTPLIERINLPDSALCENDVLVERYQLP